MVTAETSPVKEKLATDLGSQIAWLQGEMGYATDKMHGLTEHLRRMATHPGDRQSMYGFMDQYWHAFDFFRKAFADNPSQEMASKALQASGKTVAGMANKVSLILWLQAERPAIDDLDDLNASALTLISERIDKIQGANSQEKLLELSNLDYHDNPLGQTVIELFDCYISEPENTEELLKTAITGSAMGVLMWQAFAQTIATQNYSTEMPKPGLPSGTLETW